MDDKAPYCVDGVWTIAVDGPTLCSSCRHARRHERGGTVCEVDRLKLAIARLCRQYEANCGTVRELRNGAPR